MKLKLNKLVLIGLIIAAGGISLMAIDIATLTVYCDSPYGTYDCTPYVPPTDPCGGVIYCTVTTTSTAQTTTTTTIINRITSTQTLTNTVTDIRAFYVTSTVSAYTTSTITSTSTIASYFTTTITNTNNQVVTSTVNMIPDEPVSGLPLNQIGFFMLVFGTGTAIVGTRFGGKP